MERLLKDAEAISGVKYDISSYADVISAIHVIQDEMGITGTTSKEASETISGSFAAMKGAWGNMLTSLVLGGDDYERCIDDLVESAGTYAKNIMPAVTKALGGVGSLIEELAPLIETELPGIIESLLPPLISAATALIKGLIIALPDIISALVDELPTILQEIWEGISTAFGDMPGVSKIGDFFNSLSTFFTENSGTIKNLLPALLGLVGAFKLFNKLKGITGLFGDKGGGGGGGGGLFGGLAKMNPKTALKGLLNLAIIIGGLTILAAALMWAAPYIAQLSDGKTMFKVLLIIGAVGLIGAALAGLAGIVGAIPIPVVLTGLANIALALGGFALIAAAFGELSRVDGFSELIADGGTLLTQICGIIGEMAGALVGGFGVGVTEMLPAIGENLSEFATSIKPMFDTFAGVDTAGLSDFATALGALILVLAGESLLGVITGGIDYAGLGTNLSTMAANMGDFFAKIMEFPDEGFAKATALFDCLAGIASLPKEGGVVGWFQGEVDYTKMADGLNALGGTTTFFEAIQSIPDEAFTKASALFDCLAGISALPKDGGVTGWFQGEVDYTNMANGLNQLAGASTFFTAIQGIPDEAFNKAKLLFDALGGISAVPTEGGIFGWFTGSNTEGLTSVAAELPGVASNIAAFYTNIGERSDFSAISNLFDTLGSIELNTNVADKGFWSGVSALGGMGTELSTFASNGATFFSTINDLDLDNLTGFWGALGGAAGLPEALSTLDIAVGTALTNMLTKLESNIAACAAVFTDYVSRFAAAGMDIMNGLNNGMLSKKAALLATARGIAKAISTTIDSALDIHSPSRVTFDSGAFTGEGLRLGMQSAIPDIRATANQMGNAAVPYTGHYSPEADGETIYNNGRTVEYTTISPSFNLTISGTQDDRATARKVKQYVAQAIQDTFESFERKQVVLREA